MYKDFRPKELVTWLKQILNWI